MNFWLVLNSFGAIALFIFGMKLMSDGVQRASGKSLRKVLHFMTRDKFRAFFAGLTLTSIIQSSSAVSVLTLSFVNAGLLNLLRAFAIIIGANIGTTVTLWLVGVGMEISLYEISLPLIALALPFYFSKKLEQKGWATFVIGFSLVFVGLGLLKNNLTSVTHNPELIQMLNNLQGTNYLYTLLFIVIGIVVTVIVQSSSASTAIVVSLLSLDFPLELCAAMIVGANIGTTATAQLAASIGNYYTKVVANFHTLINVFGAVVFFFFLGWLVESMNDWMQWSDKYYSLAMFHTLFNITIGLLIFPFLKPIAYFSNQQVRNKSNTEEGLKMMHSSFSVSPEMFVYEANRKLISFAGNTKQTIMSLGRLITESDGEKFEELHERILVLEKEGDEIEADIAQYLNTIYDNDLSGKTSKQIHYLLNIAQQLENIGDIAIKTSHTHKKRRENNSFITPKLRTHLIEIQDTISTATTHLIQNLNEQEVDPHMKLAKQFEDRINEIHNEAMSSLVRTTEKGKIKPLSALYYKELIQNYEIIGDHIYKANVALIK